VPIYKIHEPPLTNEPPRWITGESSGTPENTPVGRGYKHIDPMWMQQICFMKHDVDIDPERAKDWLVRWSMMGPSQEVGPSVDTGYVTTGRNRYGVEARWTLDLEPW